MELISTIAITLATLAILVGIHEYGHFWVARRCGVKVLKFSIGFGKSFLTWKDSSGTEYSFSIIPLGGFVKMLDEREGEVAPEELDQAFNRKPVLQRIAVVAAGPLANFALAIVAYWFLFMNGETGVVPIIDKVAIGSEADIGGLEAGQEIIAVDGRETPTWQALSFRLLDRLGESGPMHFAVKYPDSEMIYESEVILDKWLAGAEAPDLFGGLGLTMYTPDVPPVFNEVVAGGAAEKAGLLSGDQALRADGTEMVQWMDWVEYVRARPGQPIDLVFLRSGEEMRAELIPATITDEDGETYGQVGLSVRPPEIPPHMIREFNRGPIESLTASVIRTGELSVFTLSSIKKMLMGLISPKNLSGPITIAKVASASAKSGLEAYISFLALLSVSLGVLNLLPIPVLDGGHLLYYLVELVVGRPVPEKVQMVGYQLGLFIVLGIMALALYNDFARL
jgi:regulator of sigma E protease